MANKCLVTRLKAAVQNDDLPLFDTIKMTVNGSTTNNTCRRFGYITAPNESVIIKVDGDGYFASTVGGLDDPTKRMTETSVSYSGPDHKNWKYLHFSDGQYNIYLINAHNIVGISLEGAATNIRNIIGVDLEQFKNNPGIVVLSSSQGNLRGSINDLPTTIEELMIPNGSDGVYGNIDLLAARCKFSDRLWLSAPNNITGSIEGIVAGQVSQGITNGVIYLMKGSLRLLTFGGSTHTYTGSVLIGARLEWTGNEKILIGAASSGIAMPTSIDAATTIYAKGATSSEISAWEAAGKTVVVVTDDGE